MTPSFADPAPTPPAPSRGPEGRPALARFWRSWGVLEWAAVALWASALVGVCLRLLLSRDHLHSVYDVYVDSARHWLSRQTLYRLPVTNGFRYSPAAAIAFVPFTLLPDRLGEIVWRLFSAAAFLGGLGWCCAAGLPRPTARRYWGAVFLLTLPLALGALNSGNTSVVLTGALLAGVAAALRGRWNVAAIGVAVACLLKLYPVSLALLLAVMFPRRFSWRFALALAAGLALPFALREWGYVAEEHRRWFTHLVKEDEDRSARPITAAYQDLRLLFRVWLLPLAPLAYTAIQLAGAATIAAVAVIGRRARWPLPWLLGRVLSLACCWMTLLGMATESSTYVMLAPALAWATGEAFFEMRSLLARLTLAAVWVGFLSAKAALWFPHGRAYLQYGSEAFAALLLSLYLLATANGRTARAADQSTRPGTGPNMP